MEQSDYTLSTEETSRLLIESFLSIANRRDEKSISFLLGSAKIRFRNQFTKHLFISFEKGLLAQI